MAREESNSTAVSAMSDSKSGSDKVGGVRGVRGVPGVRLSPAHFLSEWLFLWVPSLMAKVRTSGSTELAIPANQTSDDNGKKLESFWIKELELAKTENRFAILHVC
jgi:hypothetical protein